MQSGDGQGSCTLRCYRVSLNRVLRFFVCVKTFIADASMWRSRARSFIKRHLLPSANFEMIDLFGSKHAPTSAVECHTSPNYVWNFNYSIRFRRIANDRGTKARILISILKIFLPRSSSWLAKLESQPAVSIRLKAISTQTRWQQRRWITSILFARRNHISRRRRIAVGKNSSIGTACYRFVRNNLVSIFHFAYRLIHWSFAIRRCATKRKCPYDSSSKWQRSSERPIILEIKPEHEQPNRKPALGITHYYCSLT